jgi:predicted lipid-binding transport protein (Tim44 family)
MGRSFLSGLGGGLLGGMIGSMLFGGMAGARGWGGSGGFGFGALIIILVILAIVFFVIKRFRARKAMEMTSVGTAYAPSSYTYNEPASETYYEPSPREGAIAQGLRHIADMDPTFNEASFKETMEDTFFKIQTAWTKRDLTNVKNLLTSQMENTFRDDINRYVANKQFNRLENIAVRQIEIVDAVQDQGEEYITVKFLASLLDYVVDEINGQTVSGSTSDPVKFLEYWTFTRKVGERNWLLAGITQEGDYQ